MATISVIILTFNEQLHIKRCIDSVKTISKEIYIVDSYSSDKTTEIAESAGAKVVKNTWRNSHALQFNWALDNISIRTDWVLRLDADEYLTSELVREIQEKLDQLPADISGVLIPLKRIFLGKEIKRGIGKIKLLRLFRTGRAKCEHRWMDEHIILLEGKAIEFAHDFADHNLNNLSWWSQKHVGYAIREAVDLLDIELGLLDKPIPDRYIQAGLSDQAAAKRRKKLSYSRQPLFLRAFAYFIYRYFLKGGFLDGKEGFLWHFLQGWWYRTLVDAKIYEIKQECGNDINRIKEHCLKNYGIHIDT